MLDTPLRFKCSVCKRRGLTLAEQDSGWFRCVCGSYKEPHFWTKLFTNAPEQMTLMEGAKLIGLADASPLRKAILRHKLKVSGKYGRYVTREDLITYYTMYYNRKVTVLKERKVKA